MLDLTSATAAADDFRYRLLVENITDYAIYLLDPTGIVSSWNAGARRFKGYEPHEIIGQNFSRFYTPEDQASGLPQRALAVAADMGTFQGEGWRLRKDGTRFWASVVIDPIRDPRGKIIGFAKITRDQTERRATERAQRESQEQFRLLVQGVTDYAIYMLSPEGVVSSWNPGAERIKGYTAGEIIGQHFSKFYTEEDRRKGAPENALRTALREGRFEKEGTRVRKDGTHFTAHVVIDPVRDAEGKLVGFAKITRDITERKATESLQASEAQFRSFAQSMPNQVWAADAHGKLNWFSQRTLDYIGLPFDELAGDGWARAVHPEDLPKAGAHWAAALASGQIYETEFRIRRGDGVYRWYLARAAPIRDEAGNIVRWIGTNTDIEASKQAEEQRLLLLGELNHRVKNLFALVGGIVALSARNATTAGELAEVLRGRLEALSQAHELIQPGLRPLEEAAPGLADLAELISRIFSPYAVPQLAERVKIAGPKVTLTEQAATGMALVCHELATNAAKYGALREADGRIEIGWRTGDGVLTLRWTETGYPASARAPERIGFGTRLVRRTIESQFGGTIAYDWNANGVAITMTARLASLQGTGG